MKTSTGLLLTFLATTYLCGCSTGEAEHGHQAGEHGGFIVSVGRDHYHAEVLFTNGELRMFMLGEHESQILQIHEQEIRAYLRPFGDARSEEMTLTPDPQPGDDEGYASIFAGPLPDNLAPTRMTVVVPDIKVRHERYRFSFTTPEPLMPRKVSDDAERELYLTPGGIYSESDIQANGGVTASEKFKGFVSSHDSNPPVGARICPITKTLANSECSWIVGGYKYEFCCPPCIDEFVRRAKTDETAILAPDAYRQK